MGWDAKQCAGGEGRCDVRGGKMRLVSSSPLATTDAQGEVCENAGAGRKTCLDEVDRKGTVRRSDGSWEPRRATTSPCLGKLPCAYDACEWTRGWRTRATCTVGWTDLASHLPLSRCRRGISSPTLSSDLVPLRVMRHFPGRLSPGSTLGFSSDGTGTCTLSSFLDRPSISHPFFRSNRSRFDRTIRSFSSVAWSLSKGER